MPRKADCTWYCPPLYTLPFPFPAHPKSFKPLLFFILCIITIPVITIRSYFHLEWLHHDRFTILQQHKLSIQFEWTFKCRIKVNQFSLKTNQFCAVQTNRYLGRFYIKLDHLPREIFNSMMFSSSPNSPVLKCILHRIQSILHRVAVERGNNTRHNSVARDMPVNPFHSDLCDNQRAMSRAILCVPGLWSCMKMAVVVPTSSSCHQATCCHSSTIRFSNVRSFAAIRIEPWVVVKW